MRRGSTRYEVRVANPRGRCRGLGAVELDGVPIRVKKGGIRVPLDGRSHLLSLRLDAPTATVEPEAVPVV